MWVLVLKKFLMKGNGDTFGSTKKKIEQIQTRQKTCELEIGSTELRKVSEMPRA